MKHRILTLFLTFALLIGAITPVLAESVPWESQSLHGTEIQRSLVRAYGNGYEYFTYSPTFFGAEGRLGMIELDLDGDGADEILIISLGSDQAVTMNVYENSSGSWISAASAHLYDAWLTCNIQANDVFLAGDENGIYICNENWTQENGVADGAEWQLKVFAYDGTALNQLTDIWLNGTDVSGDLNAWRNDDNLALYRPELREIAAEVDVYDFSISSLYWGNMICEQDSSVNVLSRTMSVQDVTYDAISRFTGASGSSMSGFRSLIVDCSTTGYSLPMEYFLSSNTPSAVDEPAFTFGTGTVIDDETATEEASDAGEYIIPDSDVRELTTEELSAYDKDTLALIRNEILARYGYPFQKQKYRDYFGSKSWYTRNESFTYGMLTSLEMENIELIKKLEAK